MKKEQSDLGSNRPVLLHNTSVIVNNGRRAIPITDPRDSRNSNVNITIGQSFVTNNRIRVH